MDAYVEYSSEGEHWGHDDDEDVEADSILLSLVQSYEWAGTLERIQNHPDECKAVGVQGRTPLHVACDHDAPAQVVEALLKAYPEASLMVGTSNMNPLHITCSSQHASVEVVRVLLNGGHDTQTSMRDIDGDTPLHAACRCGAPIEVLRVLLETNPSVVHDRDYEGLTPLLRLWVRCFVMLGDDILDGFQGLSDLMQNDDLNETWKKTELLLRCAHLGSLSETTQDELPSDYKFRPLHAVAAVDCPRPVVKMATLLYPKQLEEIDEIGMTPLLIASKAPLYKVRDLSDEGYMLEERVHGDGGYNNNGGSDNNDTTATVSTDGDDRMESNTSSNNNDGGPQPSVIDILVNASPNAANIPSTKGNSKGRLPIHVAIASGKPWKEDIKSILTAYPEAISVIDPKTGLYPFLQAASAEQPNCGVILELLKKDPSLAELRDPSCSPSPPSMTSEEDIVLSNDNKNKRKTDDSSDTSFENPAKRHHNIIMA